MKQLLSGNEAIARGAYEAGVKFAAAYPGTPSTEILEEIAKYEEIDAQWSPNEKVALEVAAGACLGGWRSLVAMKHVGVNVAADPLFSLSYMGVNAGLVMVSADDPAMHSSQNEQDNRHYAKAAKIPMLEPSDSQEAKDFTIAAFQISEDFDTPVMLRSTTRISHSKGVVQIGERPQNAVKTYKKDTTKNVLLPSNARLRHIVVEERMRKLEAFANECEFNRLEIRGKSLGIIASGVAYQYAKEVFPEASFLKLGLTHPLPRRLIQDLAGRVDKVYVIEELDPFLEEQIRAMGIEVMGKNKIPVLGELNPDIVTAAFNGTGIESSKSVLEDLEIPRRPPVLCPGCSHRGVFYAFKKLKLTVLGDIGCYTLGALPPLASMDTCLCMGASVGMTFGMEKAVNGKVIGVIGDSTFIHSGITGLINIVYNKGMSTLCILDNHSTAMTGHQEHPGTGFTLKREKTHKLDLEAVCKAIGVRRVFRANPYDIDGFVNILKQELVQREPSVIIADAPCIIRERIELGPQRIVDRELCSACMVCMKLGCPAIELTNGKPRINTLLCAGCDLCEQVCKLGAIQKADGKTGAS